MYRIGDFSVLSKITVKALRFYEKEELLLPAYVDKNTKYRYYRTHQLLDAAKIVSLRQLGFTIEEIKRMFDPRKAKIMMMKKKHQTEEEITLQTDRLQRLQYLLEEKQMKYKVIEKNLPEYIVFYKEGVVKEYSDFMNFIPQAGEECKKSNPKITCLQPDYCFVSYLDGQYKDHDIRIRYSQAVTSKGVDSETICFTTLPATKAVCIYHIGAYERLGEAYGYIMQWIEHNGYEATEKPRECYIDGIWNKENVEDWLTEIQVPVRKK